MCKTYHDAFFVIIIVLLSDFTLYSFWEDNLYSITINRAIHCELLDFTINRIDFHSTSIAIKNIDFLS